jgi:integration host factor subunit beta
MNTAELVDRLWEAHRHLTQREAKAVVAIVFDEVTAALSRGDRVELRGFGTFSVRKREARIGRDPRSGDKVAISEKHHLHFKTGKQLQHRLQGGSAPAHEAATAATR